MAVRSLNKVMLIGNLTRDPELRYTSNGTAVASMALATNKSWKNQDGEMQESVEYHNLVAWGKTGEICHQLLSKGVKVYIEGELTTQSWEGDDGVKRYKTEVKVSEMILLDSKGRTGAGSDGSDTESPDSAGSSKDEAPLEEPADVPAAEDDDLPF